MALRADDVDLGRDRALVVRYQSGDRDAFDDLYRRYFVRLQRFCERRVGDPHEAEEIAQEAFVRALRAMPEFAGERRFYPWMTVIASRLCIDVHRRRQRSTPVAEVELGSVDIDLDDLFAEVDHAHLREALGELAPRHREVLELRERRGWSYQRIADHYDVTLGTVEALLHRARRALRREFERATAGDNTGALAAIPGLAWSLRRLDSLRSRAAHLGHLATPLSTAVASAALAAGSFVVAAGGGGAVAPAAQRPPAVVSLDHGRLALSAGAPVGDAPSAPDFGLSATAPPSVPPPITSARPEPPRVAVVSSDDARQTTMDAPVRHDVAGVGGVAADPAAVSADLLDRLQPLPGRNP